MQKYGLEANNQNAIEKRTACLVCDDPRPRYAWTDYSGEGYCLRCGIPYQLKWGVLEEGESYPRINLRPEAIPMFRRYFAETGKPAGQGVFMRFLEYPEVEEALQAFNSWWNIHREEYPELQQKTEEPNG